MIYIAIRYHIFCSIFHLNKFMCIALVILYIYYVRANIIIICKLTIKGITKLRNYCSNLMLTTLFSEFEMNIIINI